MIYIVGDLHIRKEEPFFSSGKKTLEHLEGVLKKGDTLIQLGDWFHTSRPYPSENEVTQEFLKTMLERDVSVIVLAGNHDFLYAHESYSISPFKPSGVKLIFEPTIIDEFLFLPWIPDTWVRKYTEFTNLKEYYENYISTIDKSVDYVLYHFEDETSFLGPHTVGIDLSPLEKLNPDIMRIGGHIHVQSDNYLGTPYQTRYDEKDQIGKYLVIDGKSVKTEEFPVYHKYIDVDFADEIPADDINYIVTIDQAPSLQATIDKWTAPHLFIRDVSLVLEEERDLEGTLEEQSNKTVREYLQDYIQINKVSKKVGDHLLTLFS